MKKPLQIIFHGMPKSEVVEEKICEKLRKLEKFYPYIISCRVAAKADNHNHHQGNQYHIRIDIATPSKEIVISHEHHDKKAYEDIFVAISNAFDAATRQLKDYAQIQRYHVKNHGLQSNGTVVRLYPNNDYGFIESSDGREIYFHRNSETGAKFDTLIVGDQVRYIEEDDDIDPQASIVYMGM